MQSVFATLLCILCCFSTSFSRHATLSSSYLTTFEDNQCILRIELLCTTQGLESLRWWFDNNQVVAFTYFNAMFPHTVYNQRGIVIKIINAVVDPSNANRFAGTSMLTTNATVLQRLHRDTIQCGTNAVRSQSINVQQLKHDVLPPAPHFSSCSLVSSHGTITTFLQFSPSFTSQHAVEWYRVSVSPDPTSCSSSQVSPSETYNCSGLMIGNEYNFNTSGMNCAGQEGDMGMLRVTLNDPPPVVENVSVLYLGPSNSLHSIEANWSYRLGSIGNMMVSGNNIQCTSNVSLRESTEITIESSSGDRWQRELRIQSNHCYTHESTLFCSTQFLIPASPQGQTYSILSKAVYTTGLKSQPHHYRHNIDGSSLALLNFTLTRKSNITFALCSVNNVVDLNCSVQYSQDLYYTNFSPPITGPINSPFPISLPDSSKDLYYQASIMLNSSLKVIVRTRSPFSKEIHHGVTAPALITIGLLGSATAALFLALLVCLCLLLLLFIKVKRAPSLSLNIARSVPEAPIIVELGPTTKAKINESEDLYSEIGELNQQYETLSVAMCDRPSGTVRRI